MNAVNIKEQNRISFIVQDTADAAERAIIEKGLNDFGLETANEERHNCYIFARLEDVIIGGLYAVRIGQGFYIKQLWVDGNHRDNGIGVGLMQDAESEALAKGCKEIWVDTLSYQAPDFYAKRGYQETARVAGYRAPHDRIFFKKDI